MARDTRGPARPSRSRARKGRRTARAATPPPDARTDRALHLPEIPPGMQPVAVLVPALADVVAVVHVRNHDVAHAVVGLALRLLHRGTHAADDQHDTGGPGDEPFALGGAYVLDVDALAARRLEEDYRILGSVLQSLGIVIGEGRYDDAHADLEAAACAQPRNRAVRELAQQVAHRRKNSFLLDADRRVAEARGEFERVDPVVIHDAVDVDVTGVAGLGELRLHLLERRVEKAIGLAPERRCPHLAGGRADVAGEELLVLEIDAHRRDELPAVEELADRDLDAHDAALELELLHLVRPGALVVLQHLEHVAAVLLLADEEQALDVLRLAARLDDVAVGVLLHVRHRLVERGEVLVRDGRHADVLQLLLAERAVVLQLVRIGIAADHGLAAGAQLLGKLAHAEDVVEHHEIGPVDVAAPILSLGHEALANAALLLVLDPQAHVVAFLHHLPGDVGDETVPGYEEKFRHCL